MRKPTIALLFLLLAAGPAFAAIDAGMVQKALAGRGDRFIEVPQARGGASYVASSSVQTMRFGESGIEIRPRFAQSALQYQFAGASAVTPVPTSSASGILYNWFVGSRENWAHDLRSYSQIAYRGLWSGIDATYSGDARGLKYHFDVAPGVDPSAIRMVVRGASDARIAADGAVEWTVGDRLVRDEPPVAYQGDAGHETIVPATFKLTPIDAATWSVSIVTASHDRSKSLTVDPAWTAFAGLVGGNSADQVYSVAMDAQGNTYACGVTASVNVPTTAGGLATPYDSSWNGDSDAFVVKFSPLGAPAFVTYFGGGDYDVCTGIAVHTDGTIYITGGTQSTDFPFFGSSSDARLARSKAGHDRDAFVAKFLSTGNALVFSGVLGGTADDQSNAIGLDAGGNAFIAGYSKSADFPTHTGPSTTLNGAMDAFVARIISDGSLVTYAGFIGGDGDIEVAHGIAVASDGTSYVVGETNSATGLPTRTALRTLTSPGGDAFVTKIAATGSLSWFALLSGTAASSTGLDRALAVALDPNDGNLLVVGETDSDNFPADDAGNRLVPGGAQSGRTGGMDGFVVRMNSSGTSVLGASYLGGGGFDTAEAVAADGHGGMYVAGTVAASSSTFPVAAAAGLSTSQLGGQDGFVAKVTGSPLVLTYSGFLGSSVAGTDDAMHALAASHDTQSVLAVGGATSASSGFTGTNGTALLAGGTNGVAIRVAPYHTPLAMSASSGTPQDTPIGSAFSQALKVKVVDADNAAVSGISVTFAAPGSGASAVLVPSTPVTTDASGFAQVTATANGTVGGPYTVSASANASGVALSASFSLTNDKLAQTISFGTLSDRTYGDPSFLVSATATSGLDVTFSSTTPSICSVSSGSVSLLDGGTCTIQADQAGDGTYAAAPFVRQSFSVGKASQSIDFPAITTRTFAASGTFGLSATATSTLGVTFSSSSSACSVVGTTATMLSMGTCTVVASQAGDSKYSAASSVMQDIGIRAAPGHLGDFDATGKADLLWQNADGRAAIWLMNGLAISSSAEILPAGTGFHAIQAADLDGDGKADLVWAHPDGRVVVWIMDGFAHGAKATLVPAGSGWSVVAAADLDGDGKADLVWQHTDGTIAVWTMNGVTRVNGANILGAGTGWSVTRAADFDGDGKADLLLTNADGRVAVLLMNGTTVRSTTEILPGGTGWSVVATPDLNGDGRADIVWRHTDGSVNAWLMNGASTLSTAPILAAGTPWSVALAGDFDGDGMDDLLFTKGDGSAAIYLMNGTTPKQTTQILNAGAWSPVKLRDLNGDGKLDILWQNADGRVSAWLMDGTANTAGGDVIGASTGWSIAPAAP